MIKTLSVLKEKLEQETDAVQREWRLLEAHVRQFTHVFDALRALARDDARFELLGAPTQSVPLQMDLQVIAENGYAGLEPFTAQIDASCAADETLRRNMEAFFFMALDSCISVRPPVAAAGQRVVLMPVVNLENPAFGAAVNHVTDTTPLDASLVSLNMFS